MKILITGNCGFIGQNFILKYMNNHNLVGVDKLSYASNFEATKLCKTHIMDISETENIIKEVDVVVNFAAESHVDNSIKSAEPFIMSNYVSLFKLLELVKKYNKRLVQISTDEVYGDLTVDEPSFENKYLLKPSSPYSATKAAADLLILSYVRTYGVDAVITRSSNNYGPYQYEEKLIPVIIKKALNDENIPIYGTGQNIREWIYVEDNCEGVMAALKYGKSGEIYHLGSGIELTNINLTKKILSLLNKPESLITFVKDRNGHDYRYALNCKETYSKLNWKPKTDMETGLSKTVKWYKETL